MNTTINGQQASGIVLKASTGYVSVPEKCECHGVFYFNVYGEIECSKCHLIFEGN